jgi:hypothetical protein
MRQIAAHKPVSARAKAVSGVLPRAGRSPGVAARAQFTLGVIVTP